MIGRLNGMFFLKISRTGNAHTIMPPRATCHLDGSPFTRKNINKEVINNTNILPKITSTFRFNFSPH